MKKIILFLLISISVFSLENKGSLILNLQLRYKEYESIENKASDKKTYTSEKREPKYNSNKKNNKIKNKKYKKTYSSNSKSTKVYHRTKNLESIENLKFELLKDKKIVETWTGNLTKSNLEAGIYQLRIISNTYKESLTSIEINAGERTYKQIFLEEDKSKTSTIHYLFAHPFLILLVLVGIIFIAALFFYFFL